MTQSHYHGKVLQLHVLPQNSSCTWPPKAHDENSMHEHIFIKDMVPHKEIQGVYLVGAASQGLTSKGQPFWKIDLRDASGSLEAKIWSPLSEMFQDIPAGTFMKITARTSLFREQIQASIESAEFLGEEHITSLDMANYVLTSPHDVESMWDALETLCKKELTHKPWRKFVFSVFKDEALRKAFKECPAAKNIHHAYRGGLLEHSLGVARLAMSTADHYPEIDRQVLLVGAIFHDVGKIWEYTYGLVTDYSHEGRLLGHMTLALEYLQPFLQKSGLEAELVLHFKHLILSHHGSYEFGSPRVPHTAEALLLHYMDNVDAKMAQCRQIFSDFDDKESGWSSYQRTLERQMFKAMPTPQKQAPATKAPTEAQCLSLLKA